MAKDDKKNETFERKIPEETLKKYKQRFATLKKARLYMTKNDFPRALKFYQEYLHAIASFHFISESKLSPDCFKNEANGISEMLLISHVYWDLAKSFDRVQSRQNEAVRCLSQFVKFSKGFKYQQINARMIKKHLKRTRVVNSNAFQQAYNEIYIKPKGCYIATMCYGKYHPNVSQLKYYRDQLLAQYFLGKIFIQFYYQISPSIITYLQSRPYQKKVFVFISKCIIRTLIFALGRVRRNVTH